MKGPIEQLSAARLRPSLLGIFALAGALALLGALTLAGVLPGPGASAPATAQPAESEPAPHTDASVPASDVTMIGATPSAAPGSNETWGVGRAGSQTVLVHYTKASGWSLGPALPSGFAFAQSPLAGQITPAGAGAMVGTLPNEGGGTHKAVLLGRPDAGVAFAATAPVPAQGETLKAGEEPLLKEGEALFSATRAPMIAPLDEEGGAAGVLLAPVLEGAGVESQVLHWDGQRWTSEPIAIPVESASDFRVLGIGASSSTNAFLLAQLSSKASYPAGAVALFRRVHEGTGSGAKWSWQPVGPTAGEAEPLTVGLHGTSERAPFTVPGAGEPPTVLSQVLTVTSLGVWIDGERADIHARTPASTTLFFKPEGSTGQVQGSWCLLPASVEATACQHELPEALPSGFYRSIAWPSSEAGGQFGGRVITGLAEGVSLRLDGEGEFKRVLALGAGPSANLYPGAQRGAAFTSPSEGWLGADGMPVHLSTEAISSRLTPWPVPFRHALLGIAPQPGAPTGALSSEAVAVGDFGAVARFKPGQGWLPESLFGPGQRVEHPRLRAVAWPSANRVYAVGDRGAMWLYRGEIGQWERDPATPLNFRGNMLGVAFQPGDPAYGFAVGSSSIAGQNGVLLRYGKTWTQEAALPLQVQGASFTSVAFAGSEAIVAYRQRPSISRNSATGGLLVKASPQSGWTVDEEAAAAMKTGVPVAVAGLPDGGAAFTTIAGPDGPRVYEREAPGSPWRATSTPLPGSTAGQLALFRENGALRAIVSAGGISNESEPPSPAPGFPPSLLEPFPPVAGGPESGGVLRQTASGWSDETHELNPAGEPPGSYTFHDLPYRTDPILGVLVDPTGGQGWAIGGNVSTNERLETGDVERYPADGSKSLGTGSSQVPLYPQDATFAIGGGAQCAAPCADRADAGIGPDVWLSSALSHAAATGARAFLYTGPRVTAAETQGPKTQPIPFAHELGRYAQILASSPIAAYAAISPDELDARPQSNGAEALFESAFSGFPQTPLAAGDSGKQGCTGSMIGCQTAYYSFLSAGNGGTVQAIVLDDSSDLNDVQLTWLESQLTGARESKTPAIVIGNADLDAQIAAGDVQAANVAHALVQDGASAYFYDSPEENVHKSLEAGGESIPAFGSGTLGYVNVADERFGDFHGASGFLLGQVDVAAPRDPATNRAPVSVRLIPNIGELALEAVDGLLLRRSNPALFAALARRPRAGGLAVNASQETQVDPYIPIPSVCVGQTCASAIQPEYTFTSSNPDIGGFVKENLASPNPHTTPLQGPDGKPIPDEPTPEEPLPKEESGLFCAYNPGTTIVTINAGGLSSSLPVTVQAGSVREPCGTVPLKHHTVASQSAAAPVPAPAPAPAPAGPAPASSPPPVPLPPPPALVPPVRQPAPRPPTPFFVPTPLVAPLLAFVLPPFPTPARPTPPSGTSAVTSPVEVAEHEEEDEEATESVSNQAAAYHPTEHEPSPVYVLGIVLLAAFAGASIRARPRRGRRELRVAPATISTARAQRRMSYHRRGRRP